MKKFYILLITMFLVNGAIGQGSIPVPTIGTSAKYNHPAFSLQNRKLNSMENVQGMMGNKNWKTSDIYAEKKSKELINYRTPRQRTLIQIYDSIYNWVWDTLSIGWKISSKITGMVYDSNNNQTSETHQVWNGSVWVNSLRYIYIYDANKNQINFLEQIWNGNVWDNDWQRNYTYDANNNQTNELCQLWYDNAWHNAWQFTYTYDANNNKTSELYQESNGSALVNVYYYTYVYDASNNLTNELAKMWNDSVWEIFGQTTFTYDAKNNLTNYLFQSLNDTVWVNNSLFTYTYDVNNNQTSELFQYWSDSVWVNFNKFIYTYDANNNQTSWLYQRWNNNVWVNQEQDISTYDADNFKISDTYSNWSFDGTILTLMSGDSTYYYFHTVGINDLTLPLKSITVYPNPSSGKITIQTPAQGSLSILNISGQEILQQNITEKYTTIDVSKLQSGVYFVRIKNDKRVEVGKFVKQ